MKSPLVFPAPGGGNLRKSGEGNYLDLDNFRARVWKHALEASGIEPVRRMYDLRHTYITWQLRAGVNPHAVARRAGTSLEMIDKVYGHLMPDADEHERRLMDAWDYGFGQQVGNETPEAGTGDPGESPANTGDGVNLALRKPRLGRG